MNSFNRKKDMKRKISEYQKGNIRISGAQAVELGIPLPKRVKESFR